MSHYQKIVNLLRQNLSALLFLLLWLQEIQRNMSKMTGCFIKLPSQLPNILKKNAYHKDEKLEAIQTFLDGIKLSGHATQCNQIYYQ